MCMLYVIHTHKIQLMEAILMSKLNIPLRDIKVWLYTDGNLVSN